MPELILENNYNVKKAMQAARRMMDNGTIDVWRHATVFPPRLRKEFQRYQLEGVIQRHKREKSFQASQAVLRRYKNSLDNLAADIAEEPGAIRSTTPWLPPCTRMEENGIPVGGDFYRWRTSNINADEAYKGVLSGLDGVLDEHGQGTACGIHG